MIEIVIKLHKTDFVIFELFFMLVFCTWYWVLFLNGASKWSEDIKDYYKEIKFGFLGKLYSPLYLKVCITIALFALIGAGYGIIINKINNF